MWIVLMLAVQLNAQDFPVSRAVETITVRENSKTPKAQEMTILVSSQDLYLDQEGILVNYKGDAYSVRALEKHGGGWLATIVDALGYCPQGHPMCGGCGLCHKEGCRYFVKHCSLWR